MEAVGEGGEDFEGFLGDALLASGGEGSDGAEVVEAVGEFDDEDADVVAGGDEEFEEIIASGGEVGGKVAHALVGFFELGGAVNHESDVFAEGGFDLGEGERGIFDGVVKDAGDDGVFVHAPTAKDFLDGDGVDDEGFAGKAGLASVGFGCDGDSLVDTCHRVNYIILVRHGIMALCLWLVWLVGGIWRGFWCD